MTPDDDVEDGEELFDYSDDDGQDAYEELQELKRADSDWLNKPQRNGFAPADFIYNPLGRDAE